MAFSGPGGSASSGGGGGLRFRTPPDQFTAATLALAEQARDAAITNVPAQLAEFTADVNLAIILTNTGTDPHTTIYQSRRGGAWANVTLAVTGPRGPGPTNAQVTGAVQAGVKEYARTGGPEVPDTEIPAGIMRDAEFTGAAVLALLGLTPQELNALRAGVRPATLTAWLGHSDGSGTVVGDVATYEDVADFQVFFLPTATGRRPSFRVPAGRRLIAVYSGSRDLTSRFPAIEGDARSHAYDRNLPRAGAAITYRIRTVAA